MPSSRPNEEPHGLDVPAPPVASNWDPDHLLIASASTHEELVARLARSLSGTAVAHLQLALFSDDNQTDESVIRWDAAGDPQVAPATGWLRSKARSLALTPAATALMSDDCVSDPRFEDAERALLAASGLGSLALYPLQREDGCCGLLAFGQRAPHAHSDGERRQFHHLAMLCSIGLTSCERHTQSQRQIARSRALNEAARQLALVTEEQQICQTAAKLLVERVGFVDCWIGMVDHAASVLREAAAAGAGAAPGRPPLAFPLGDRSINIVDVLYTGQPFIIRDALARAEAQGWGDIARAARLRNAVVVPLRAGDQTIGAVGAGQARIDITDEDVTVFSTFTSQLATAVARARADRALQAQLAELEAAHVRQAGLLETVRELSTPVIPVYDGVLVLPLVGTLDTSRSTQVTATLLDAIQKQSASVVIIDVTGMPFVDTGVANHLLKSARAAALLGARCILVGISPGVAQTIVQLGVDLGGITTCSNLQAGISYALSLMHREIRSTGGAVPARAKP